MIKEDPNVFYMRSDPSKPEKIVEDILEISNKLKKEDEFKVYPFFLQRFVEVCDTTLSAVLKSEKTPSTLDRFFELLSIFIDHYQFSQCIINAMLIENKNISSKNVNTFDNKSYEYLINTLMELYSFAKTYDLSETEDKVIN